MNKKLKDIEAIAHNLDIDRPIEQLDTLVSYLLVYRCVNTDGRMTSTWKNLSFLDRHMFVLAAEYAILRLSTINYDTCYESYIQNLRNRYQSVQELLDQGFVQVSDAVNQSDVANCMETYGQAPFVEVENMLCTEDGYPVFEWNSHKLQVESKSEIITLYDETNEAEKYVLCAQLLAETESLLNEAHLYLIRSNRLPQSPAHVGLASYGRLAK